MKIVCLGLSIVLSIAFASARKFQFVVMGDNRGVKAGVQPEIFKKIVKEVNLLNPDFVVIVGDLILGYTSDTVLIRREWREFKRTIAELEAPFYPVAGNHDIWDEVSLRIYKEEWGKLYYSFDHKGCHFIVLNSEIPGEVDFITKEQLNWLKEDLKKAKNAKYKFVFLHKPVWAYEGKKKEKWIEEIHPILVRYKVNAVFSGHWHVYEIDYRDGIRYIITGGAGAPVGEYPEAGDFFHYLLCTVEEEDIEIAVIKPGGILPEDVVKFKEAQRHHRIRKECVGYPCLTLPLPRKGKINITLDNPFSDSVSGVMRWNLEGFGEWRIEPVEQEFKISPFNQKSFDFKLSISKKIFSYPTPRLEILYPYAKHKKPVVVRREIVLVPQYKCKKAPSHFIIDGNLKDWQKFNPIRFNKRYQLASRDTIRWEGKKDKTAEVYFSWDEEYLYFAVKVIDDVFYQEGNKPTLSLGDCVILSFDVGDSPRKPGKLKGVFTIYFFALTKEGPIVYRRYARPEDEVESVEKIEFKGRRNGKEEVYEGKLPWGALKSGFVPLVGGVVRVDIVIPDNDGEGRENWFQWTPGLMQKGNPAYFGELIFY